MILVNGCSMTECRNLTDPSKSWPQILSDCLNTEVVNLAIGGASNQRIVRTTQEWLHVNPLPDLIIIGWTECSRAELPLYNGQYARLQVITCLADDQSLLHNPDLNAIHDFFYRNCYNEYLAVKQTILDMLLLQQITQDIPCIFFNALSDNHFQSIINGSAHDLCKHELNFYAHEEIQFPENLPLAYEKISNLLHVLDPGKWLWSLTDTYLKKAKDFARDDTGHFLEDGNAYLAREIKAFYDTLCQR